MTDWFTRRTSSASAWNLPQLLEIKADSRIAVVIPARNEASTVGTVVSLIASELMGLVDELVVMDSLSTDGTAEAASKAGAKVHSVADVRPDLGVRPGKGEALWKSLFVTTADLLVFIDADLTEWGTHFVTGLLGPLLTDPSVKLVRGFYDRVLDSGNEPSLEGGRVTELVARPWLALHRPQLSRVVQPLAGEWAIRRSVFEELSVPVGYGVELSTLLDIHASFGLDAIAQVDLGRRAHRHQSLHDLAVMATELMSVGERRRQWMLASPTVGVAGSGSTLGTAVLRLPAADRTWKVLPIPVDERPAA
ncbi:MAG: glucosyl-3-phosphoglycerate synthase, partial [Candidatus Nanopelagicales bacterium]